MARTWTLALAASLLAVAAQAQEDPIGDLLSGPSLSPAEAPPAPAPAPATSDAAVPAAPQPELGEEGEVIPPPAPRAVQAPESAPVPPVQAATPQPYVAPPAQAYAAPPPSQAAPPVANLPTGPIPYQALTPSPATPRATMAAPSYAPAAPYVQPPPSYASPTPAPPYSSPPMGVASAPPSSSGIQSRARSPVHIDEHGRTPDAPPTYRELDYEQRLRSSYASAQGLQGPLDGGWTLSVDGDDRYFLQLVERSSGLLEGVWRDLRRTGALNASGFVEGMQRYGGQLSFSFRPDGRDELATATLTAGGDGKWSGELVRGRDRKSVTLRRN